MKLRNKKTGEIATVEGFGSAADEIQMTYTTDNDETNLYLYCTQSLTTFNEDWEDYEEPKKYWFIDAFGNIVQNEITKHYGDEYTDMSNEYENQKQIGNYFETKEEAEKAVEKLKAWKRLNGETVGWSFSYGLDLNGCGFNGDDIVVGIKLPRNVSKEDLDLLFGVKND